jgi:hypothetical protein
MSETEQPVTPIRIQPKECPWCKRLIEATPDDFRSHVHACSKAAIARPKPGFLTSEFVLLFLVALAGFLPSSGLLPEAHWGVKLCGLIVSGFSAAVYLHGRVSLKKVGLVFLALALCLGSPGCAIFMGTDDVLEEANLCVQDARDAFVIYQGNVVPHPDLTEQGAQEVVQLGEAIQQALDAAVEATEPKED